MVFSILIILLVGLIAYFHYTQGFFSATISAIISIMAALLAVSYDETVVNVLLKGAAADIAHSIVLCGIFAITYTVLRVIFDAAVPGNVRTPSTVDKIGAGLMGVVCGIFATGIFAIAVQMLPFGPTISLMGYSRYTTTGTRDLIAPGAAGQQNLDAKSHDELTENEISGDAESRAKEKPLWFPVDDWVLATVYHVSDGGSLAGDRTLASVHPDYLQELFGERLGQQDGARRSALQFAGHEAISLGGVFTADSLPVVDGIVKELRTDFPVEKEIKSDKLHQILIVRLTVHNNATDDEDGIFRFSTGSIHLVAHPTDDPNVHDMDYYPIGTMQNASIVLKNKPDDFLFLNVKGSQGTIDAVFQVGNGVIVGGATKDVNVIAPNTFISIKRLGLIDLSGQNVVEPITAPPDGQQPLRSKVYMERAKFPPPPAAGAQPTSDTPAAPTTPAAGSPTPAPAPTPAATPTPNETPKASGSASASINSTLPFQVGCTTDNNDAQNLPVGGGTISLKGGNISVAQIDPTDLATLAKGDSQLKELAVPDGFKLVQVAYTTSGDPYAWVAQIGAIQVLDGNNNPYKANGVIVMLNQGSDKAMLRYDMNHAQFAVPTITAGAPKATTFLFLVRSGTHLASLQIGNDTMPISADVP